MSGLHACLQAQILKNLKKSQCFRLLPDPDAVGASRSSRIKKKYELINGTVQNSGQWLGNVDSTYLVPASGKSVLQIYKKVLTAVN